MSDAFLLETPLWEIALRCILVYVGVLLVLRLIPKRQSGEVSPNDLLALIIVGALAADAIIGDATSITDIFLMVLGVLMLDYLFNLIDYHFPAFRKYTQDDPTLLIHDGRVIKRSMRKEKMTDEELEASLRRHGVKDIARVKQAVLEVDGRISIIEHE